MCVRVTRLVWFHSGNGRLIQKVATIDGNIGSIGSVCHVRRDPGATEPHLCGVTCNM